MPTGQRIRANNVYGVTTDNPLAAGATTINSTQLVLLPGVTGGAHAVIVLDPKRVNGQPEIVIVTAHTGLATAATITRAAYGTIARSHPVGTVWAHVTVDEDYTEILSSTTRPLDPFEGQSIYEIDTKSHRHYNGTGWNSSPPVGTLLPFLGATAPDGYLMANGATVSRVGSTADLFAVIGTTYGVGDGVNTFGLPNLNGKVPVGRDATQAEFDVLGDTGGTKTVTLTQAQLAQHAHGVTDPTHNHGQTVHSHGDANHNHPADDNFTGSHQHDTVNQFLITVGTPGHNVVNDSAANISQRVTFTDLTEASGGHHHDITVSHSGPLLNAVNANIQGAGTGVTVNQAGSNEAHNNLQPYITVNYIIKI